MSGTRIEGIMCLVHRVELASVISDDAALADKQREHMRRAGERHSQEQGGGCKIEPWKEGALSPS